MKLRAWLVLGSAALAAATVTAAVAGGTAAGASASRGVLSPRLTALAHPGLATAAPAAQARAVALPATGAGSLLRHGADLLAYVQTTDTSAAGVARLRRAGAAVVDVSPDYGVVTVAAPAADLPAVAGVSGVTAVREALAPAVRDDAALRARPRTAGPAVATTCGSVTSEGDAVLDAALARSQYGVDGTGVTVGVLSDSYDTATDAPTRAAQDIATGDLPGPGNPCGRTTPVRVVADFVGGEDEGRAMLQIVHDLAPGARLAFSTAFDGEYAFAHAIRQLYSRVHASVIVDDVTYFDEPYYQSGPVANAVEYVTAHGVSYSSSSGNNNFVQDGHDVGSYEAPAFRAAPCPAAVAAVAPLDQCHDYDAGPGVDVTDGYTLPPGGFIDPDLQWAEPWGGITDNFGLFVLAHGSGRILASSTYDEFRYQEPFQFAQYANERSTDRTVDVVIARLAGTGTPRLRDVIINSYFTGAEHLVATGDDRIGLDESFGHNATPSAISTAATYWQDDSIPEFYSSRGPLTYLFGPATGTHTPAAPLPAPEVYAKPDVTATDGVHTTFFYGSAPGQFFGTSAAAPHAAAVAALVRQYDPSLGPAQIKSLLTATAVPLSGGSPDSTGAGLVDAYAALTALATGG